MKMVIIEPLGVEEGKLLAMAKESLGDRVEIVYYNTKTTDTAEPVSYTHLCADSQPHGAVPSADCVDYGGIFQRFASGTGGGGHCGRLYQTEML